MAIQRITLCIDVDDEKTDPDLMIAQIGQALEKLWPQFLNTDYCIDEVKPEPTGEEPK